MNEKTAVSIFFKFIALVAVDIATILMICSVWALTNLSIFPLALAAAILALIFLNLSVLFFGALLRSFGVGAASSMAAASVLFYLYTIIGTGVLYPTITVWGYSLQWLLALAIYAGAMFGLIVSGNKKKADQQRQQAEKLKSGDLQSLLLSIREAVRDVRSSLEKEEYDQLKAAIEKAYERVEASSPFGRSEKATVSQAERAILEKLSDLLDQTRKLKTDAAGAKEVAEEFEQLTESVKNREKLFLY